MSREKKKNFSLFLLRNLFLSKDSYPILIIILIFLVSGISILKPRIFLSIANFKSMSYQLSAMGLMVIGLLPCMITGGIDLSVVGICNLVGIVTGTFLKVILPPDAVLGHSVFMIGIACLLGVIIGMACGLLNGLMIGGIGIPAILATMGSNNLFLGICLIITAGSAVSGIPPQFPALINHEFFGVIPLHLVIFIVCAVLASIMLSRTNFGIRIFLMGTNPKASYFAGLNNFAITIRTYMFSGVLCAIAGHLTLAHNNSSRADYGSSLTLQTILICVLGGTSPNGGAGTVLGTVLAIIILQIFSTGLNMFPSVNAFFKDFVWGVVLILVMILQYFREKFRNKI